MKVNKRDIYEVITERYGTSVQEIRSRASTDKLSEARTAFIILCDRFGLANASRRKGGEYALRISDSDILDMTREVLRNKKLKRKDVKTEDWLKASKDTWMIMSGLDRFTILDISTCFGDEYLLMCNGEPLKLFKTLREAKVFLVTT